MSIKKICDTKDCISRARPDEVGGPGMWITVKNGDLFDLHFCSWNCLHMYAASVSDLVPVVFEQLPLGFTDAHL